MPRKVEIQQSDDYTDDDPYEITYTDGKSTRHKVTEQQISDLHIRVNDNFVMLKWMFLAHGCSLVILISLVILFTTSFSSADNCGSDVTATLPPITSASTTAPATACEEGWIDGRSVDLGCIFLSDVPLIYSTSIQFCVAKGAHLIEFQNKEQIDFVRSKLSNSVIWWAGATNPSGKWYWTLSGKLVDNFVWATATDEPGDVGEYLCFANGFYGHDCSDGSTSRYPMCQKL